MYANTEHLASTDVCNSLSFKGDDGGQALTTLFIELRWRSPRSHWKLHGAVEGDLKDKVMCVVNETYCMGSGSDSVLGLESKSFHA